MNMRMIVKIVGMAFCLVLVSCAPKDPLKELVGTWECNGKTLILNENQSGIKDGDKISWRVVSEGKDTYLYYEHKEGDYNDWYKGDVKYKISGRKLTFFPP